MSTHYQRIGGEPALRQLTRRFYEIMDELPETYALRKLHPEDLSESADKLFEFLSGWTGGPQLFIEKHGHPMLRRRHMPFSIGREERDQWLLCMKLALEEVVPEATLRDELYAALARVADHMRNRPEGGYAETAASSCTAH
ncbi:MAG: group II truncated hemoglobin [Thiobacillus sp.]|nr:group II truncated hemoglobin [Thiobacillus sp.]